VSDEGKKGRKEFGDRPYLGLEKSSSESRKESRQEAGQDRHCSLDPQPFGWNIFPRHDSLPSLGNPTPALRLTEELRIGETRRETRQRDREGERESRTIVEDLITCEVINLIVLSKAPSPEIIWIEMPNGERQRTRRSRDEEVSKQRKERRSVLWDDSKNF
jgi:hypothetical protein